MTPDPLVRPPTSPGLAAVPRAVWLGGGMLALACAAMAGALVTKTGGPSPAAVASTAAAATPALPPSNAPPTLTPALPPTAIAAAPLSPTDEVARPVGTPVPLTGPSSPERAAARSEEPLPTPVPSSRAVTPASKAAPRTAQAAPQRAAAACRTCGRVEASRAVKVKGDGTGLGAVGGGVLGGVVGNQVGGGTGRAAMTVLGAIGGGLAGHEVEKRVRGETVHDVSVRMQDGSLRIVRQAGAVAAGTRVRVENGQLRIGR